MENRNSGNGLSLGLASNHLAANRATALRWLGEFQDSETFSKLAEPVRVELDFSVRVFARCFTRRWNRAAETPYSLSEMTADDAVDLLVEQLPHNVSATDPNAIIDALVAFLVWAAKTNRLHDRSVEYASRKAHRDAQAAMGEERRWSPGKAIVTRAMRDGVDPSDLELVRQHAIGTGLDIRFVEEFLPPPPVSLGNGRHVFLGDEVSERATS